MKAKRILSAVAALSLLSGTALAGGAMTPEEMNAIWQASFDKMNTTSEPRFFHNYDDLGNVTIDPSYEMICRLPSDSDMPYAEALSIAREAIFGQYGTPEDELDAMGVYPDFIAAEEGYSAEWRFFFTPMRDTSIDLDHDFPAPGEYRVYIDSPSGEVTFCNWYIDNFWPYAQRTWDAGKRDIVYGRAQKSGYLALPAEEQALWLERLEAAGYDMTAVLSGETLLKDGYFTLDLRTGSHEPLPDDDPRAIAAWQALETTFGLDTALMRKYHYIAFNSPIEGNDTDVFVIYDATAAWAMARGSDVDYWCAQLLGEVDRLGLFLVRFDPATGEARYVTRGERPTMPRDIGDPDTLLGNPQWSAADLPRFDEAYQRLEAAVTDAVNRGLTRDQQQPVANGIMRELGGWENAYPMEAETPDIGLDAALPIAWKAAAEAAGMSEEDFTASFTVESSRAMPAFKVYEFWFIGMDRTEELMYYVSIDMSTGEVTAARPSQGNG